MESFQTVPVSLRAPAWTASPDLKEACLHVLHVFWPNHSKFMCFQFSRVGNKLKFLQLSLSTAPRVFLVLHNSWWPFFLFNAVGTNIGEDSVVRVFGALQSSTYTSMSSKSWQCTRLSYIFGEVLYGQMSPALLWQFGRCVIHKQAGVLCPRKWTCTIWSYTMDHFQLNTAKGGEGSPSWCHPKDWLAQHRPINNENNCEPSNFFIFLLH